MHMAPSDFAGFSPPPRPPIAQTDSPAGKRHTAITMLGNDAAIIEDSYLLAAMITYDPELQWLPVIIRNESVGFQVSGRIADAMGRYFKEEPAPLQQYISNLKMLRSAIFASKHKNVLPRRGGTSPAMPQAR